MKLTRPSSWTCTITSLLLAGCLARPDPQDMRANIASPSDSPGSFDQSPVEVKIFVRTENVPLRTFKIKVRYDDRVVRPDPPRPNPSIDWYKKTEGRHTSYVGIEGAVTRDVDPSQRVFPIATILFHPNGRGSTTIDVEITRAYGPDLKTQIRARGIAIPATVP